MNEISEVTENNMENDKIENTDSEKLSGQEEKFMLGLRKFLEHSRVTLNQKLKK